MENRIFGWVLKEKASIESRRVWRVELAATACSTRRWWSRVVDPSPQTRLLESMFSLWVVDYSTVLWTRNELEQRARRFWECERDARWTRPRPHPTDWKTPNIQMMKRCSSMMRITWLSSRRLVDSCSIRLWSCGIPEFPRIQYLCCLFVVVVLLLLLLLFQKSRFVDAW